MNALDHAVSRNEADAEGFAGFNSGPHLCVDVPDGHFTITTRNSQGRKVTFAFCPVYEEPGHQCVDIQHHSGALNDNGIPIQQCSVRGQGPLLFSTNYYADEPATLLILSLEKGELGAEPKIRADVHSDDRVYEVDFDATPWFEHASDEAITGLIEVHWGGDYEADVVARSLEDDNGEIGVLLDYCRTKGIGFEVSVNSDDAIEWLKANRPDLYEKHQESF